MTHHMILGYLALTVGACVTADLVPDAGPDSSSPADAALPGDAEAQDAMTAMDAGAEDSSPRLDANATDTGANLEDSGVAAPSDSGVAPPNFSISFENREGSRYAYPYGVDVADFDEDGRLDIVATSVTNDEVRMFLGDGAGGFANSMAIDVSTVDQGLVAGDFTGDGHADVALISNFRDRGFVILVGDGRGSFRSTGELSAIGNFHFVKTADLDQDGVLDLITSSSNGTPRIETWFGGSPVTQGPTILVTDHAADIALGDLNADGFPDVVVASDGNIEVALGVDGASFGSTRVFALEGTHPGAARVAVADVTGDGIGDVIHNEAVLFNDGRGVLTRGPPLPVQCHHNNMVVAQFTGDARPDVVCLGSSRRPVLVEGAPGGVFNWRGSLPYAGGASSQAYMSLAAADMDGNGHTDLLVTGGSVLRVMLQEP